MLDNGKLEIDCSLPQYKPSATVQERVLAEPQLTLDEEWVVKWFMSAKIYDYVIEKVKLSDLQFNKLTSQGYRLVPLAKAPAYQYLQGDKNAYRNYMKLYQKYEPDTERSQQRFDELLNSLADNDYDDTMMVVMFIAIFRKKTVLPRFSAFLNPAIIMMAVNIITFFGGNNEIAHSLQMANMGLGSVITFSGFFLLCKNQIQ